jgi:hypothetical protein
VPIEAGISGLDAASDRLSFGASTSSGSDPNALR